METVEHPSPNFGKRKDGAEPSLIVLHYTGMETAEAVLERLCDPEAEVSCHFLIAEDGRVFRLVDEAKRAWHAGAGAWGAVSDVNSHSLGIELANQGDHPFPEPQFTRLEFLLRDLATRWSIPPERVIGHSDMSPDRKIDPGLAFDWRRLAMQGLSVWPEGEAGDLSFCEAAHVFGYRAREDLVLKAFRLRFRPEAAGRPLEPRDTDLANHLARLWPSGAAID